MGEVTLSTGKVVTIDTSKFTWKEWRSFFSGRATQKEEDAFVEKASGINAKDQGDLLRDDFRRIIDGIKRAGSEPLADPLSVLPSTEASPDK